MSINPGIGVRIFALRALLLLAMMGSTIGAASAQDGKAANGGCWQRPAPETLEEIFLARNKKGRARQAQVEQGAPSNTVLLISNGALKTAYSAGLLVGWGETGERPRFAAVTAVGASTLIAPFAFIGSAGDQAIADIFNCHSDSLDQMAERAASFLNESVLAAIAREHEAGRRLFLALPGSAARAETVWDIGSIAKSGHAGALPLVRNILLASTGLAISVQPADALKDSLQVVPRNPAFRKGGSGPEFLLPPQLRSVARADMRYFLILNDSLIWDDSADYIASRRTGTDGDDPALALLPGSDIIRQVVATKGSFRFASPKAAGGLLPQSEFDRAYLRALFHYAFRQARMGKEWLLEFPGL